MQKEQPALGKGNAEESLKGKAHAKDVGNNSRHLNGELQLPRFQRLVLLSPQCRASLMGEERGRRNQGSLNQKNNKTRARRRNIIGSI
jgi:hypothetical protein